jgi:hypothetical protein
MFKRLILTTLAALSLSFAFGAQTPAHATVCKDGWVSSSTGPGTCSWHGGIADNQSRTGTTGYGSRGGSPSGWIRPDFDDNEDDAEALKMMGFLVLGGLLVAWILNDDKDDKK